jgi:hypothetical protein
MFWFSPPAAGRVQVERHHSFQLVHVAKRLDRMGMMQKRELLYAARLRDAVEFHGVMIWY